MSNIIDKYIEQNKQKFSFESLGIINLVSDYLTKAHLLEDKEVEIQKVLEESNHFAEMFLTPENEAKLQNLYINLIDDPELKKKIQNISNYILADKPYD